MSESILSTAAIWLRRGQALEAGNSPAQLVQALHCYDQAIAGLRPFALHDLSARRDLAIAWMNRGNALQKQGLPSTLADAVRAYDETIALLGAASLEQTPSRNNSLGAAWMNRGLALHRLASPEDHLAAVRSHENAVAILRDLPLNENLAYRLNLAAANINLANAWLDATAVPDRFLQARARALQAGTLLASSSLEQENPIVAELGLKARRVHCDALGQILGQNNSGITEGDLGAEGTDAVDDGLALVRHWEQRGATQFRPLALRLFYFGSQLYRIQQPHFLAEFLLDNLDPARSPGALFDVPEFQQIARFALATASQSLRGPKIFSLDNAVDARRLQTSRDLQSALARLDDLSAASRSAAEKSTPA